MEQFRPEEYNEEKPEQIPGNLDENQREELRNALDEFKRIHEIE